MTIGKILCSRNNSFALPKPLQVRRGKGSPSSTVTNVLFGFEIKVQGCSRSVDFDDGTISA